MRPTPAVVLALTMLAQSAPALTLAPDDVLVDHLSVGFVARVNLPGGGSQQVVPSSSVVPTGVYPTELAADANGAVYAVGVTASGSSVYRVDAASMTAPKLVDLPPLLSGVSDFAADPGGGLHLITGTSSVQRLYGIDPGSGNITLTFENTSSTGPLPGLQINGISFLDGATALLGVTGAGGLGTGGIYTYDIATGTASLLAGGGLMTGNPAADNFLSPDQVFVRNGNVFVGSAGNCGFTNLCWTVVTVDATTGAQTQFGGGLGQLGDLDVSLDAGTVYVTAASTISFAAGRLFAIDVATGSGTQFPVPNLGLGIVGGETGVVAVVPEPSSAVLLGVGLILLGSVQRRR